MRGLVMALYIRGRLFLLRCLKDQRIRPRRELAFAADLETWTEKVSRLSTHTPGSFSASTLPRGWMEPYWLVIVKM